MYFSMHMKDYMVLYIIDPLYYNIISMSISIKVHISIHIYYTNNTCRPEDSASHLCPDDIDIACMTTVDLPDSTDGIYIYSF